MAPPHAIRIVGSDTATVWGLSALERMRRIGVRQNIGDVAADDGTPVAGIVLFVAAPFLLEDRLVAALLAQPGTVLRADGKPVAVCCDGNQAEAARAILASGQVPGGWIEETADVPRLSYNHVLRKKAVPFVLNVHTTPVRDIEWRMFGASYKGATDFVTKWVWPVPAFHVTRLCAKLGISPNAVTTVSGIMVLLAMWLFWRGDFALGLICAWLMCFLDTVDGKLARVTVTSSKWGNVFDHGIDMIHPPFWWWAWVAGLGTATTSYTNASLIVVIAGYVIGRFIEGAFLGPFKFEMHVWRPFDFWLRAFTARRNPNLAILSVGVAFGAPGIAFDVVAAWTVICLVIHLVRLFQAFAARAAGKPVQSFLAS